MSFREVRADSREQVAKRLAFASWYLHKLHAEGPTPGADYFARLAAFHEDMHGEAFTYTRQTHGLPAPQLSEYDPRSWTSASTRGETSRRIRVTPTWTAACSGRWTSPLSRRATAPSAAGR